MSLCLYYKKSFVLKFLLVFNSMLVGVYPFSLNAESRGSIEAGRSKVSMCVGCHGIPNYKTAFPKTYRVPMIAGQSSQYIVSALKAYKAGDRSHPSMQAVAGSMSVKDMEDVAIYYSSLR